MTRIYATPRKTLQLDVIGQSVVVKPHVGRPVVRTFKNRYTLRKFLSAQVEAASKAGFVSVNR